MFLFIKKNDKGLFFCFLTKNLEIKQFVGLVNIYIRNRFIGYKNL